MKRSLLCFALALRLFSLSVPSALAGETAKPPSKEELEEKYLKTELPYTDLKSDELRRVAAWLETEGIRAGLAPIPEGTTQLLPILNVSCTRTEFYIMLWNVCGKEEFEVYSVQNPDIDPKSAAGKAVNWAYHKGLLGMNPKYEGKAHIERLEVARCLYQLSGRPYNSKLANVPQDVRKIALKEQQAVMWAIRVKIMERVSDNAFKPTGADGYCTRKDCAVFLYRFYLLRAEEKYQAAQKAA